MTQIFGGETPEIKDLEHFGVLGMKWGHRKTGTTAEIEGARRRMDARRRQRDDAEDRRDLAPRGSKAAATADKKFQELSKKLDEDPDRVLAARLTRGEKVASLLLTGPFGLIPITIGSLESRRAEFKLDKKNKSK